MRCRCKAHRPYPCHFNFHNPSAAVPAPEVIIIISPSHQIDFLKCLRVWTSDICICRRLNHNGVSHSPPKWSFSFSQILSQTCHHFVKVVKVSNIDENPSLQVIRLNLSVLGYTNPSIGVHGGDEWIFFFLNVMMIHIFYSIPLMYLDSIMMKSLFKVFTLSISLSMMCDVYFDTLMIRQALHWPMCQWSSKSAV